MEERPLDEAVARYVAMFDGFSDSYDQSGVPFFGMIARGLVDRMELEPGERVLDIGAGRGAATFPAAAAVGPGGRVDTLDLAPGMVSRLKDDARSVRQVHVGVGDATDPRPPAPPYDAIISSLVLFFLPDPVQALARWRALLRPGGRVGVSTFQPWAGLWQRLFDLHLEFSEDSWEPDPRFATDERVAALLRSAGFVEVRTELASYDVVFDNIRQWHAWSLTTPMGTIWRGTPESSHPEILRRATALLESSRDADGRIILEVGARYTIGRHPAVS
jgi:ubiquinone/menaquinone biosynthesis C-methylase UbiE